MTLYKNKYRIESSRCASWDYTSNGYYFVTICTRNREHFFGEIITDRRDVSVERLNSSLHKDVSMERLYASTDGGDVLAERLYISPIGEIVAEEWQKTEQLRPYVKLDEWMIMPNHLHGIIIIDRDRGDIIDSNHNRDRNVPPHCRDVLAERLPPERLDWSEYPYDNHVDNQSKRFHNKQSRLQSKSLGSIIGQFKSACTKRAWKNGFEDFNWQERFYDHIIRDEESLNNIREYIIYNPRKWESDRNNPANLYM